MNLTESTIRALRNLENISESLYVYEGNEIRARNDINSIFAKFKLDQEFPKEFGIVSLKKFNSIIGLLEDPHLEFKDYYMNISSDGQKFRFSYADKELIEVPMNKDPKIPDLTKVEFDIEYDQINTLTKAMNVLQHSTISFLGDGENIYISTSSIENSEADAYSAKIGETSDKFRIIIQSKNFDPIAKDNYHITIYENKLVQFSGVDKTYWVAVSSSSTFGEIDSKVIEGVSNE